MAVGMVGSTFLSLHSLVSFYPHCLYHWRSSIVRTFPSCAETSANSYRNRVFLEKSSKATSRSSARNGVTKAWDPRVEDLIPLHVTIIRPVNGLEPHLYECLASTFIQDYASSALTIYFCIPSRTDPAYEVLRKLLLDFDSHDARIWVEDDETQWFAVRGRRQNLGPNPKIKNMSRAYRESKSDIIWIVDCNVWVSPSTCGLMVDRLCGVGHGPFPESSAQKYKFVHQLPLVVDVSKRSFFSTTNSAASETRESLFSKIRAHVLGYPFGGLLEEMFLSTSHAKFYTAISAVAVAPCTVGKSNMFRRSHLDSLTSGTSYSPREPGIDYFSDNICEDHLIGDLLWRKPVPVAVAEHAQTEGFYICRWSSGITSPASPPVYRPHARRIIPKLSNGAPYDRSETSRKIDFLRSNSLSDLAKDNWEMVPLTGPLGEKTCWSNHALLANPPCIQPLADLNLSSYFARRIRWLRVRKFTVLLATLVEPGTESFLCSLYGAFGLTTLSWCNDALNIPRTWRAFALIWASSVICWMAVDFSVWRMLQGWKGEEGEGEEEGKENGADGSSIGRPLPSFVGSGKSRGFGQFLLGWLGREVLALPIWILAVFGGVTVSWRGRAYKVGMDARVKEVKVE